MIDGTHAIQLNRHLFVTLFLLCLVLWLTPTLTVWLCVGLST